MSATAAESTDRTFAERHPLRILLAEDNPVNQKVGERMLARLGYRADVVGNGVEALAAYRREPYDVILMDVQMPEMDGLEATGRLRADPVAGTQTWIIAMTANAMQGDRERCLEAGMDDYVAKPVRLEELQAALGRAPARAAARTNDPADAADPVDTIFERLHEFNVDDDPNIIEDLLRTFLDDAAARLRVIRTAIADANAALLVRTAHGLKGSSASIGLTRFAALCTSLEQAAGAGSVGDDPTTLALLDADLARIRRELEARVPALRG